MRWVENERSKSCLNYFKNQNRETLITNSQGQSNTETTGDENHLSRTDMKWYKWKKNSLKSHHKRDIEVKKPPRLFRVNKSLTNWINNNILLTIDIQRHVYSHLWLLIYNWKLYYYWSLNMYQSGKLLRLVTYSGQ